MTKKHIETVVSQLDIRASKKHIAATILLDLYDKLKLDGTQERSQRAVNADDIIAQTVAILKIQNL